MFSPLAGRPYSSIDFMASSGHGPGSGRRWTVAQPAFKKASVPISAGHCRKLGLERTGGGPGWDFGASEGGETAAGVLRGGLPAGFSLGGGGEADPGGGCGREGGVGEACGVATSWVGSW